MGLTIALAPFDQPLDFRFSEVFAGADLGIFRSARCDFPYFSGWRYDSQGWLSLFSVFLL
jgi:hypothetical protein